MASITQSDIDNVLEIYCNETQDYDTIADRCNLTVIDVANIINEEVVNIINEEVVNNFIKSI